jgi:hypothetical protein
MSIDEYFLNLLVSSTRGQVKVKQTGRSDKKKRCVDSRT